MDMVVCKFIMAKVIKDIFKKVRSKDSEVGNNLEINTKVNGDKVKNKVLGHLYQNIMINMKGILRKIVKVGKDKNILIMEIIIKVIMLMEKYKDMECIVGKMDLLIKDNFVKIKETERVVGDRKWMNKVNIVILKENTLMIKRMVLGNIFGEMEQFLKDNTYMIWGMGKVH